MSHEEQIIALEIKVTEQEKLLDELSTVLTSQWKTIDQMSKKLDALTKRFLDLEEQTVQDVPITRPPHW